MTVTINSIGKNLILNAGDLSVSPNNVFLPEENPFGWGAYIDGNSHPIGSGPSSTGAPAITTFGGTGGLAALYPWASVAGYGLQFTMTSVSDAPAGSTSVQVSPTIFPTPAVGFQITSGLAGGTKTITAVTLTTAPGFKSLPVYTLTFTPATSGADSPSGSTLRFQIADTGTNSVATIEWDVVAFNSAAYSLVGTGAFGGRITLPAGKMRGSPACEFLVPHSLTGGNGISLRGVSRTASIFLAPTDPGPGRFCLRPDAFSALGSGGNYH